MHEPVDAQKRVLRAEVRERRRSMSSDERVEHTAALTTNLRALATERHVESISCYLPMAHEPDTRPFLAWALTQNIHIVLPHCREDRLLDWVQFSGQASFDGQFGAPEVAGPRLPATVLDDADLLIIPASAVDARGMRLGWGRGFYDTALAALAHRPPVYAVVFDREVRERVPSSPHDVHVDGVVTPGGILRFG